MFFRSIAACVASVVAGSVFAQTPPSPPPPHLARNLAAQCANCHGTDGKNDQAIPALAGRPAATIIEQMNAFKSGVRSGPAATIMHQIAKGYSDQQIALMADWFAAQK